MLHSLIGLDGHGKTHHSHGGVANAPMGGQFRSKNSNKTAFDSINSTDLNTNPAEQTLGWADTSSNIPGSVQIEIYNNGKNSRISSQFGNITVSNKTDSWGHANVTEWYLLIMLSRTDMEINNLYWGEYPPPSGSGSGSGSGSEPEPEPLAIQSTFNTTLYTEINATTIQFALDDDTNRKFEYNYDNDTIKYWLETDNPGGNITGPHLILFRSEWGTKYSDVLNSNTLMRIETGNKQYSATFQWSLIESGLSTNQNGDTVTFDATLEGNEVLNHTAIWYNRSDPNVYVNRLVLNANTDGYGQET